MEEEDEEEAEPEAPSSAAEVVDDAAKQQAEAEAMIARFKELGVAVPKHYLEMMPATVKEGGGREIASGGRHRCSCEGGGGEEMAYV